jgi:hypothetical protein
MIRLMTRRLARPTIKATPPSMSPAIGQLLLAPPPAKRPLALPTAGQPLLALPPAGFDGKMQANAC